MRIFATVLLLAACTVTSAQQTVVIPVVSNDSPSVNNSTWATEVQIIKINPHDSLTVRRLWICTVDGGFIEDPATALEWDMTSDHRITRMMTLAGRELLAGPDEQFGAVALEISGGQAIVNARIADIFRGVLVGKTPYGQGQTIPTDRVALNGPSHIPWLGGCINSPCSNSTFWNYYRVNIGVVNPNPAPLTVTGIAIPFGATNEMLTYELRGPANSYQTFTITIPPYGWRQFPWESELRFNQSMWSVPMVPHAGFVMSLTPDSDAPYHAYASTVFAPDPATGIPAFNDPLFIPAAPGFVEPFLSE